MWDIRGAFVASDHLKGLLKDNWEPFTVTVEKVPISPLAPTGTLVLVWVRKEVTS